MDREAMMLDISIAAARARTKFLSTMFEEPGDAGVAGTRRDVVLPTERQWRLLAEFAALVSDDRRTEFHITVFRHLSGGGLGDAAVLAACLTVVREFVDAAVLAEFMR
jgi:hypothetical protein